MTAKAIMGQEKQAKRFALVTLGLLAQFGGLYFFKYGDFLAGTINDLGKLLGIEIGLAGWSFEAPVGILH